MNAATHRSARHVRRSLAAWSAAVMVVALAPTASAEIDHFDEIDGGDGTDRCDDGDIVVACE